MSQSRAVRRLPAEDHSADLTKLDLLYAFLLHALILIVVVTLSFWQSQKKEQPLQRIEVMMISAKQLSAIEQQSRRKVKPVKKQEKKPAAVEKPKVDTKKAPVLKLEEKPKAKPKAEPKVAAKVEPKAVAKKVEDDFDPFAPIASSSDRSSSTNKASTSRPDIANLKGQQLSKNELERYIALMQSAIQDHWKVPASSGKVIDPLVEINLAPNGDVASIKLLESSGSDLLDSSLFRAIKSAAPFQLPKDQAEAFQGLHFRFHPDK